MVPSRNTLCVLTFSHAKNFEFACCVEGFHLRIALNILKYVLFIHAACFPAFEKHALTSCSTSSVKFGVHVNLEWF